jgi:mannose-6-phosphate isomerase
VALYPLLLAPIYKEKVWGGRTLERFGRTLPGGEATLIGESWELADLAATSPSGGGGEAAHSLVLNGPLMKRTLHEVVTDFGSLVTGQLTLSADGSFPLLLKYLDARQNLSVQVHPSSAYAAAHPDAHLKSEAWYVVDAEPDAVIYKGIRAGTSREAFEEAVANGTVEDVLIAVPARAGDCHYLPSGTCHALGGGVLVAEVQTPSDTTFRVFDWGRTDRELHLAQALECIDFGAEAGADPGAHPDPVPDQDSDQDSDSNGHPGALSEASLPTDAEAGATRGSPGARARDLVVCEHFTIRQWKVDASKTVRFATPRIVILMVIDGEAELKWGADAAHTLRVQSGNTVLLPAALEDVVTTARTALTMLEVFVPDGL